MLRRRAQEFPGPVYCRDIYGLLKMQRSALATEGSAGYAKLHWQVPGKEKTPTPRQLDS